MRKVKENLASYIENENIQDSYIAVFCNIMMDYLKTEEEVKNTSIEQMTHLVKWMDIIVKMNSDGLIVLYKLVRGMYKKLIKQILLKVKAYNISYSESIERIVTKLKNM